VIHEWASALNAERRYLYWALRWGPNGEESAKKAWEAAMSYARNTHCWRLKEPMLPPHLHNCVIALGDGDALPSLQRMLMAAQRVEGAESYVLEDDFVRALVLRRARLMAERLETNDFGMKVFRNKPHLLDREGRIKPHG